MTARLAVAALLLASVAGGLWWVVAQAPDGAGAEGARGEFRTVVVGPSGEVSHDRNVTAEATPLAAVQALAALEGFTVEVEQQPWIGSGCTAAYVVAIAGDRETARGGWNYYVRSPGGSWEWKPAGAACHGLQPGDEVEWCWVELDVCRRHAP